MNTSDSIQGGSTATNFKNLLQGEAGGVNKPESVLGGSAPTNFSVTPEYASPAGGTSDVSDIQRGGAYTSPVKVGSGQSTNDRAK